MTRRARRQKAILHGTGRGETRRRRAIEGGLAQVFTGVVLRYYQQRSEAETAEILEIPKGTVKSRLHAAITAMRREVSSASDPKEEENA